MTDNLLEIPDFLFRLMIDKLISIKKLGTSVLKLLPIRLFRKSYRFFHLNTLNDICHLSSEVLCIKCIKSMRFILK
jgi:hypothetical protein